MILILLKEKVDMLEIIVVSIISFIGTNIDDIFINTLFFSQAETKNEIHSVIIAKYLGIGTLVVLSLLGALGLNLVQQRYIGLLGIIPIILGIKEWISCLKKKNFPHNDDKESNSNKSKGLILSVVLVTVANGADNLGVYIPLFIGYSIMQIIAVIIVFSIMIALWCILGKKLSDFKLLRDLLLKYKHVIVPIIFIILGVYIIIKGFIY